MPSCLLPCFSPWWSLANPPHLSKLPVKCFLFLWVVLVMMSLHNNTTVSKSGYVSNLSVTMTKYLSNTMHPEERLILYQGFGDFNHEWLYPLIRGPTEAAHSNGRTYWGRRELSPGGRKEVTVIEEETCLPQSFKSIPPVTSSLTQHQWGWAFSPKTFQGPSTQTVARDIKSQWKEISAFRCLRYTTVFLANNVVQLKTNL